LRILEVEEIKSIPYVPVSHPFVERLIGTIRRKFLDHVLIWNAIDLERKLEELRNYYNENRVHQSLSGSTPGERSGKPPPPMLSLITMLGGTIAAVYSRCQSRRNYEFAMDRLIRSIRRECLDHVVSLGTEQLHRVVKSYASYYNTVRTHRWLDKDAPVSRAVQRVGRIVSHALVDGLDHQYARI
jgi:transposase InsO family protein